MNFSASVHGDQAPLLNPRDTDQLSGIHSLYKLAHFSEVGLQNRSSEPFNHISERMVEFDVLTKLGRPFNPSKSDALDLFITTLSHE